MVALIAYVLTAGGETVASVEPEPTEATVGTVTSTTALSGTAAAAQAADLSFGSSGVVTAVSVSVGDVVSAGDVLATIDDSEAARQVETAQISLDQAQAAFATLLEDPATADLAAALASVSSAQAQVLSADDGLDELLGGATSADILSATTTVQTALSQVSSAEDAVNALSDPATAAELASAGATVTQAQAQLNSAANEASTARDTAIADQIRYCSWEGHVSGLCSKTLLPLREGDSARVRASLTDGEDSFVANGEAFLESNARYLSAVAAEESAAAALAQAEDKLASTEGGPDASDWFRANQTLESARANYEIAVSRLQDLRAPATDTAVNQAEASASTARANLTSAQARYAELVGGADVSDLERQQQSVRLAEIGLERAREGLDDARVIAPFDGVVGAVNIAVGDSVGTNTVAIAISTPERMTIELTVSEAEVLDLEVGQIGLATFSAVGDTQFPVRITSVSTIPSVSQGVVTYAVAAVILEIDEIPEVAADLQSLTSGAAGGFVGLGGAAGLGGAGAASDGRGAAGGGPGGAGGLLAGIELPDGVTIQEVFAALSAGEALPDGVVLPEGFELPAGFADRLATGGAPGQGGAGAGALANPDRQLPLAGMSGSVEVLLGVRDGVLLVPSVAVRSQGGTSYVIVENAEGAFERRVVVTGDSSGANVEVVSGLEAGDTVWLNASAPATEEFSLANVDVTQATAAAGQQFGPGGFAGGGGGFVAPGGAQ
ncbi:MAG: HlyD family efflux transporter periplasmic adaptor subunit [Chloroflexi bacterium]|nr:HlyD family efflux transporter periplasmic adaptor subunit [Chloroflexota bacterium]